MMRVINTPKANAKEKWINVWLFLIKKDITAPNNKNNPKKKLANNPIAIIIAPNVLKYN